MKRIILGAIALSTVFISCKKDDDAPSCASTVAGIANSFKITKFELITAGQVSDQTSILGNCTLGGVYQLKTDKTVTYTEGSGCGGTENGTWDVVNNKITISVGGVLIEGLTINSWDCTTLVITEDVSTGGFTISSKYYLTKQ